jgi:hypothetical protein
MDAAIGAEKTSSIATRHGAVAAINAGYFRLNGIFRGDAAGVLQIDGKLLSESFGNRIALGVLNGKDKTEIEFGHLKAYKIVGFGTDSEFVFSGINRERKINEIILYTADFHRTTLTNADGTEIILSDCSIRCRKVEVVESKGSSIIPPDGYVISSRTRFWFFRERKICRNTIRSMMFSSPYLLIKNLFSSLAGSKKGQRIIITISRSRAPSNSQR